MIKNIFIDQYDIMNKGYGNPKLVINEEIDLISNTLQLTNTSLVIHDRDKVFSTVSQNSIFFNQDVTKFLVKITDENDLVIYEGKILRPKENLAIQEIELELENGFKSIFEQTAEHIQDVSDQKTPMEIAETILINTGLNDAIDTSSFSMAINRDKRNAYYIGTSILAISKINVGTVLERLSYLSGCDLFVSNGKIFAKPYSYPSTINISSKTFTESEIIETVNLEINENYLRNSYNVDVKGISDNINQTYSDITFNNIGQQSRDRFGIKDLELFNLNIDNTEIYTNITSQGTISVINVAENYLRRFMKPLKQITFKIITTGHRRYNLGEFIKVNLTVSNYDLNNVLFYIIGLQIDFDSNITEIKAVEEVNKTL